MKKLAMVFPGQGSQSIGMLAELANQYNIVSKIFEEASSVLGYDVESLIKQGPVEQLNKTEYTQPILLAASFAVWQVWRQEDCPMPTFLAGHSLGEYTALVCAEALSFTDAIILVKKRGEAMQRAVPDGIGGMAAIIGLEDEDVRACCKLACDGEVVEAVNFNAPGQVVVSGHVGAVERVMSIAKEKGARLTVKLPVSIPSHCVLMKEAAHIFSTALTDVKIATPKIPVIQNVDVQTHSDPAKIRENLLLQLYSPVRWSETIQSMGQAGVTTIYECGPGKVLSGLNRRILPGVKAQTLEMPDDLIKYCAS